jgi:hypothetical protein
VLKSLIFGKLCFPLPGFGVRCPSINTSKRKIDEVREMPNPVNEDVGAVV